MAYYEKQIWTSRQGTALNKFSYVMNGSDITLTSNPTSVTVEGTPFTAERMNKIEEGIYKYSFNYGSSLPSSGTEGQLFFKIV